jgi:hypothetical protein
LRGEPLELVAREANVSIARLTEWRERALAGAATALKERDYHVTSGTPVVAIAPIRHGVRKPPAHTERALLFPQWCVVFLGATCFVVTLMKRQRLVILSPSLRFPFRAVPFLSGLLLIVALTGVTAFVSLSQLGLHVWP